MNSRMNSEKIMDALNLLDEDMAEEVQKLREKKPNKPPFLRYGLWAACFLGVCICVWQFGLLNSLRYPDIAGGGEENATASKGEISTDATVSLGGTGITDGVSCGVESITEDTPENETGDDHYNEGTEELPAARVLVEKWENGLPVCIVDEESDIFPVGERLVIRFDKWELPTVTEEDLPAGSRISVMFDGYNGNEIFAVGFYVLEGKS